MSREKKHTPGPWKKFSNKDGDIVDIIDADGNVICVFETPDWGANNSEYDAHLIAAAPELLEALEFMMDKCTLYGRADAAREKADLAIAKAYGEGN